MDVTLATHSWYIRSPQKRRVYGARISWKKTGAEINFECGMTLVAIDKEPCGHSTHCVFCSPQPMRREESRLDEQPSNNPRSEVTTRCSKSWLVRATENTTVAPRCRKADTRRMDIEKGQILPSLVCVEPALIPIQVLLARVLSRVGTITSEASRLTSQRRHIETGAPGG